MQVLDRVVDRRARADPAAVGGQVDARARGGGLGVLDLVACLCCWGVGVGVCWWWWLVVLCSVVGCCLVRAVLVVVVVIQRLQYDGRQGRRRRNHTARGEEREREEVEGAAPSSKTTRHHLTWLHGAPVLCVVLMVARRRRKREEGWRQAGSSRRGPRRQSKNKEAKPGLPFPAPPRPAGLPSVASPPPFFFLTAAARAPVEVRGERLEGRHDDVVAREARGVAAAVLPVVPFLYCGVCEDVGGGRWGGVLVSFKGLRRGAAVFVSAVEQRTRTRRNSKGRGRIKSNKGQPARALTGGSSARRRSAWTPPRCTTARRATRRTRRASRATR